MKGLERKPIPRGDPPPAGSLAEALAGVPDPRRPYGWRPDREPLPLAGLLQLAVAALLCGCRSLYAIARWGRERVEDDPTFLVGLGLPPARGRLPGRLSRALLMKWPCQVTGTGPDRMTPGRQNWRRLWPHQAGTIASCLQYRRQRR